MGNGIFCRKEPRSLINLAKTLKNLKIGEDLLMIREIKLNKKTLVTFIIMISFVFALTGCQSTPAGDTETNEEIERALTPEQFEEKLKEDGAVVVDVRTAQELEDVGKYKDSIHVDNNLIQEDPEAAAELLPEDKDTVLLIHCKVGGRASKAVEVVANDLGYKNAYYLASPIVFDKDGEIKDYVLRSLNPEQFEEKLEEDGVVVVDVRTAEELEEVGKYKDSINVDNNLIKEDLDAAAKLLPEDKDTTLLIHCKVGGRASQAVEAIAYELGYKNAYYLASPIVFDKDGEIKDYVLRGLNPEQFEEKLEEDGVVVVDVRTAEELEEVGKYKDSINVDNNLIKEDLDAAAELLPEDKDTTLLIHCKVGGRASQAVEAIAYELGYKNAYYLASPIFFDENGEITGYEE